MLNSLHLKYFHDAFKFGSYSEAAKRNFVSRPAISQAIRAMETQLGEKLVSHDTHKPQPTAKGKWLLAEASELLSKIRTIEERLQSQNPDKATPVRVMCSRSLGRYCFGSSKNNESILISSEFPIELKVGDAFAVRHALQAGEVNVGIAIDDGYFRGFSTTQLHSGVFVLSESPTGKSDCLLVGDKGAEVESRQSRVGIWWLLFVTQG
jgi:DNA-binding transcriptional LysR family regulator